MNDLSMLEIMMMVGNHMDMNDLTSTRQLTSEDLDVISCNLGISMAELGHILAVVDFK